VSCLEAFVKFRFGTDSSFSNGEVGRKWLDASDRDSLCHLYALENGGFINVQPVALEIERGGQ
jgi:hypothetical protein